MRPLFSMCFSVGGRYISRPNSYNKLMNATSFLMASMSCAFPRSTITEYKTTTETHQCVREWLCETVRRQNDQRGTCKLKMFNWIRARAQSFLGVVFLFGCAFGYVILWCSLISHMIAQFRSDYLIYDVTNVVPYLSSSKGKLLRLFNALQQSA